MLGALLAALGLVWPWLSHERIVPLPLEKAVRDQGHAFRPASMPWEVRALPSDDQNHSAGSRMRLLEDGKALGPPHSLHDDVRAKGEGRFSHWQGGLLFATSDNSDPRRNGRTYALAYDEPFPALAGWVFLFASFVLLLRSGPAPVLPVGSTARIKEAAAAAVRRHWMHAGLFSALAGCAVILGMERSAWILATQPFDAKDAANSLLGASWVMDGTIVHRGSYHTFQQVALFAGVDVVPDGQFGYPVYAFLATLLVPFAGVAGAMVAINVAAWAGSAWLAHRFTLGLTADETAARWAALFAVAGIGFAVHVLDLSGQMLSFVLYMGGVVLVLESGTWRRAVPLRTHMSIGAYLAIACLQHPMGVALVAGYLLVSLRHNPARWVLPACALAIAMQPLWSGMLAAMVSDRHGVEWARLATAGPFERGLSNWRASFALDPAAAVAQLGRYLAALTTFEMPLVLLAGLAGLASIGKRAEGRSALRFGLAFLLPAVATAVILAPTFSGMGPVAYGASLFIFAGAGFTSARLVRRGEAIFAPAAALMVVASLAWATAHHGNVLGPAKAYVSGPASSPHLFVPGAWEVQSMTNSDPVPRFFGGTAALRDAGLVPAAQPAGPQEKNARYGAWAALPLVLLAALMLLAASPVGWPTATAFVVALSLMVAAAGQLAWTRVPIAPVERIYRIEAGRSLTYSIELGTDVRRRLVAGTEQGAIVMLFPAYYNGDAPPEVGIDGHTIGVAARSDSGNWRLDPTDFRAALDTKSRGVLRVTFRGGEDVWLGGWQASSRPGRTLSVDGTPVEPAAAVPAVEIRLLRDHGSRAPLFIGF